jgi:hypothetical protein
MKEVKTIKTFHSSKFIIPIFQVKKLGKKTRLQGERI